MSKKVKALGEEWNYMGKKDGIKYYQSTKSDIFDNHNYMEEDAEGKYKRTRFSSSIPEEVFKQFEKRTNIEYLLKRIVAPFALIGAFIWGGFAYENQSAKNVSNEFQKVCLKEFDEMMTIRSDYGNIPSREDSISSANYYLRGGGKVGKFKERMLFESAVTLDVDKYNRMPVRDLLIMTSKEIPFRGNISQYIYEDDKKVRARQIEENERERERLNDL